VAGQLDRFATELTTALAELQDLLAG
jgi:hypothetical protein